MLELKEVEKPTPKDNEVLVKVHAASVNTADLTLMSSLGRLFGGLRRPKEPRIGSDVSGQVEAVGKDVKQFRAGDEIFGVCVGGFAEYATARENGLVLKPANSTFEEAASLPVAAITALQALRDKGKVSSGQEVLINGASGGVGTFAVQIAKAYGAEVTAVCSAQNINTARSMGADQVVDYTQADITQTGRQFDLILGINGYHSIFAYRKALKPKGIYLMVGVPHDRLVQVLLQTMIFGPLLSRKGGQSLGFMGIAHINQQDLTVLKELLETRKIVPVIDRQYPLSKTAEACRYLLEGHARGKVIITMV